MTKALLKQALDVLDNMLDAESNPKRGNFPTINDFGKARKASDAIRFYLADYIRKRPLMLEKQKLYYLENKEKLKEKHKHYRMLLEDDPLKKSLRALKRNESAKARYAKKKLPKEPQP